MEMRHDKSVTLGLLAAVPLAARLGYAAAHHQLNYVARITDQNGNIIGKGEFFAHGEHLFACDKEGDGKRVTAWLWWNGDWRVSVSDPYGVKGDCN